MLNTKLRAIAIASLMAFALCLDIGAPSVSAAPANYASTPFTALMTASAVSSSLVYWPGGIGVFEVDGTWNGAMVTLEFQTPDGTMLVAGTATTLTANGAGVFYLPACNIQAVVSGAGGSTSLGASVGAAQL